MGRRLFLWFTSVILILVACGYVAVQSYLPTLQHALQTKLSEVLGVEVSIGDATFQLTPLPKIALSNIKLGDIKLGDVKLGALEPGGTEVLGSRSVLQSPPPSPAHIDGILLSFAFLPLLKQQIVVTDLILQRPTVSLRWASDGLRLSGNAGQFSATPEGPRQTIPGEPTSASKSWEVILHSMEIQGGNVQLMTPEGEVQIAIPQAKSSLRREGSKLSFGNSLIQGSIDRGPATLSAASIVIDQSNGRLEINKGVLELAKEKLQFEGAWGTADESRVRISANRFALSKIGPHSLLKRLQEISPISEGVLTMDLTVSQKIRGQLGIEGSLQADRIVAKGLALSIASLRLDKLRLAMEGKALMKLRSEIRFQKLKVTNGQHEYVTETASGTLDYAALPKQEKLVTGSVAVTGFQYKNQDLLVSDVVANVSKLSARIDRFGGIKVNGFLSGTQVKVTDPSFALHRITGVSAPIEIAVPAKGGYEVRGPVTVSGGELAAFNFPLSDINGTVSALISGPLKQFRTQSLHARAEKRPLVARADFAMTPTNYALKSATLALGSGSINGSFTIARSKQRALTAQISASNIALEDLNGLAKIQPTEKLEGTISQFNCIATAQMNDFATTLTGKGSLQATQGGERAERFTQKMLRAIAAIPLVGISLQSKDEKARGARQQLRGDFVIVDKSIRSDNIVLGLPSCTVRARGAITMSGDIAMKANLLFLKDSFSQLGFGFDRLGNILGRAGQIVIPVTMSGHISNPTIEPDLAQLAKNNSGIPLLGSALDATRNVGERLINGIFGGSPPPKGDVPKGGTSKGAVESENQVR